MSLSQQIGTDLTEAMRARDTGKVGVLRMLKSAVKYAAIQKLGAEGELDDAGVVAELRKQIKQREDAVAAFEKGGRPELAEKEKQEIAVLSTYLPQGLTQEQLEELVRVSIAEAGATSRAQMGAVMKIANGKAAGMVDGRTLSAEVQKQLS